MPGLGPADRCLVLPPRSGRRRPDYTEAPSRGTMPAQEIEPGFGEERWPAVVAHRGASATHPENTLESFEAAVEASADVVELDVRLTADGVLVVSHDPGLAATTGDERLVCE